MSRFQFWYHALPKALRWLLTINVVAYLFWVFPLSQISVAEQFVWDHVAFHASWSSFLTEPWQLVTYSFLHLGDRGGSALSIGSLLHVGFNMLWLYWIARDHEETHGPRQLLALYLITGVGGALISAALYSAWPLGATDSSEVIIHGASASVLGVITAIAVMYPRKKIGLLFIGPVRLVYLVLAFLAVDMLFRMGSDSAVFAHLGGAFSGFLFARLEGRGIDLSSWTGIFFRSRGRLRGDAPTGWMDRFERRLDTRKRRPRPDRSPHGKDPETKAPPLSGEVDRVLDKISAHGIESLTDEDRSLLEEASRE